MLLRIKYVIMKNKCCHDINKMWWCAVPCFKAVDMKILCGFFFVCGDFLLLLSLWFHFVFSRYEEGSFFSRYCRFLLCQWLWQNALLFYHEFSSFAITTSTATKITKIMFVFHLLASEENRSHIFFILSCARTENNCQENE